MPESKRPKRYRTMRPLPAPLPAIHVLEGADDPVAELLFRALQEFRRWTTASPQERRTPRGDSYEVEQVKFVLDRCPELEGPVGCFITLRRSPGLVSAGTVASACERIQMWADDRGLALTALCFAEAWAGVDPENPIANNAAGRMARHIGEFERAEIWFERGYRLAARHRNRREKIRSLIGHGGMLREVGRYTEARELFETAAGLAKSTRRHRQAAEVQHELFTIAAEQGEFTEAEFYVRRALREYPIHHRAVPWLVHDWAFLLVRRGHYQQAKVLLQAILPLITRRELQVVVWGTLGRAAAGTGDRKLFDRAVERVVALVGAHEEHGAAGLAHLAFGWQFFGEWEASESFGLRAVELARSRQQADVERGAAEILANARARNPPQPQVDPPRRSRVTVIEARMLRRLRDWTKPTRREVVRDPEAGGRRGLPSREGQPTGPRMDPKAE